MLFKFSNKNIKKIIDMSELKIVDTHHHLWNLEKNDYPWLMVSEGEAFFGDYAAIRKSYLIQDYIKDAKNQNLIKSVHVQAEHNDKNPVNETKWLQEVADSNISHLPNAIVAYADFSKDNIKDILEAHLQYKNIRGIRQILSHNKDNPKYNHATQDFMKINSWIENFKHIRNKNLSFDIQIYYQQMQDAYNLAKKYHDVLFILNHTGEPAERNDAHLKGWEKGMKLLASCDNFVTKISGLGMFDINWTTETTRPFVEKTIDIFGIDRCMFGSNFPVDKLFNTFDVYWDSFKKITKNYSENDKELLFSKNAERCYRI